MAKGAAETKLGRAAGVLENRTRVQNDDGGVSCTWGFSPLTAALSQSELVCE